MSHPHQNALEELVADALHDVYFGHDSDGNVYAPIPLLVEILAARLSDAVIPRTNLEQIGWLHPEPLTKTDFAFYDGEEEYASTGTTEGIPADGLVDVLWRPVYCERSDDGLAQVERP